MEQKQQKQHQLTSKLLMHFDRTWLPPTYINKCCFFLQAQNSKTAYQNKSVRGRTYVRSYRSQELKQQQWYKVWFRFDTNGNK